MQRVFKNSISIARAQGVEWSLKFDACKDAAAISIMNTTIEIYNKVRGKVLQHHPDFQIGKLAFMEKEAMEEQGKSFIPPFDTTVNVGWSVDEENAPLFPPTLLKKREQYDPSQGYANWVIGIPSLEARPSTMSSPAQSLVLDSAPDAPVALVHDLTDDQDE
ncbi:hypothetical protein SLE2022_356810 [Rubroshorea leprosula]